MEPSAGVPIEIIEDKLYWISDKSPPKSQSSAYFFWVDNDLVYEPFHKDFGPLDLAKVHRFCSELEKLVSDKNFSKYKIYHYTALNKEKQANAAFLMGAFMIIILNFNAEEAWKKFAPYAADFKPFRDATMGVSTYKCTIEDWLQGLYFGIKLGWYNYKKFNYKEYEYYEKVEHGDMNWIVPGKFMAFSGPSEEERDDDGWRTFTPDDYAPIFKKFGIHLIVRLNKKAYDEQRFIDKGFAFEDLYFVDGTTPSKKIVKKFLKAAEAEDEGIAIHWKAGLGRTGTLIGLYWMKHYGFPAAAFIGWIRICRPGSILGPQQHYLNEMEQEMIEAGGSEKKRDELISGMQHLSLEERKIMMSPQEKEISKKGDHGQAEFLNDKKRKSPSQKKKVKA